MPAFGGTSLSKDIDFKVTRPAVEPQQSQERAQHLSRKRILAALTGADFILAGEPTRADENHFFSADLFYPNLFDAGPGLRPHIRVEMTLRPPALPPIPRPLASLIGMAQQKPPEVAAFLCVDPVETAADKLSALAWRVHARHQTWANTARRPRDHASRHGAMAWCEENDIRYVFGLSKNAVLDDLVYAKADEVRTRRAIGQLDIVRDFTDDALRRQILVAFAPRGGADRGDTEGPRYPLRRHQHHPGGAGNGSMTAFTARGARRRT